MHPNIFCVCVCVRLLESLARHRNSILERTCGSAHRYTIEMVFFCMKAATVCRCGRAHGPMADNYFGHLPDKTMHISQYSNLFPMIIIIFRKYLTFYDTSSSAGAHAPFFLFCSNSEKWVDRDTSGGYGTLSLGTMLSSCSDMHVNPYQQIRMHHTFECDVVVVVVDARQYIPNIVPCAVCVCVAL